MELSRWWNASNYALKALFIFAVFSALIGFIMFILGISSATLDFDVYCPNSGMDDSNPEGAQHIIEGFFFVSGILQMGLGAYGVFSLLKLNKGMIIGLIIGLSCLALLCLIFSIVAIAASVGVQENCDDLYQCDASDPCACVAPAIAEFKTGLISTDACDKLVPMLNTYASLEIIWTVFAVCLIVLSTDVEGNFKLFRVPGYQQTRYCEK